jgi:hypothetical protein
MLQRYKTNQSNEVHQLVVAVSRHSYVTAAGKVQRQKKAFEVRLDKPETFTKVHLVHYLLRDHFSGLFYAELADSENIFPVHEFLYRAWSKKESHPLYGIPLGLTVPGTVRALWPDLISLLKEATIETIDVTSGFQGGIRDLRTWENELHFGLYESGSPPDYEEVLRSAPEACANLNISECRGNPKAKLWRENLPETIYVPCSKESLSEQAQALGNSVKNYR